MRRLSWLLAAALLAPAYGCGEEEEELAQAFWFTGRVFDGATGAPLSGYSIELRYADKVVKGKIEGGRYRVGPLEPFHDFTVRINASGYRSFSSHNEMFEPDRMWDGSRWVYATKEKTYYFDAVLFPQALQAPAARIDVTLAGSEDRPRGQMRLAPTSRSFVTDNGMPAGVDGQMWINDDDLQFNTVHVPFENGRADLAAGMLVYGVRYQVVVFGVNGYGTSNLVFVAGGESQTTVVLQPLGDDAQELRLAYSSATEGLDASGKLVLVFNQPIQWDPLSEEIIFREAVDNGFSINSPDLDGDGNRNELFASESARVQERGTTVAIEGNALVFTWDRARLRQTDDDDPILSVTWGNLNQLRVKPVAGNLSTIRGVSTLAGSNAVQVFVTPSRPAP